MTYSEQLSDKDVMASFCSLGLTCELGIAQRFYKSEPVDLLRWSATSLSSLLKLLENDFSGLGDGSKMIAEEFHGHFMITHADYGFSWHAFSKDESDASVVIERECRRLPRVAEKLREELRSGDRIFVRIQEYPYSEAEKINLVDLIKKFGNSTLLLMGLEEEGHPFGSIESVNPNLLMGYIDKFSHPHYVESTTSPESWLAICRKTLSVIAHERSKP